MGWFGGSSESSSSESNMSGGSGDYGSKLRTPSSELDLSDYSSSNPLGGAGDGDIQLHLQREQQKAINMSAVCQCHYVVVVVDDVLVVEVLAVVSVIVVAFVLIVINSRAVALHYETY